MINYQGLKQEFGVYVATIVAVTRVVPIIKENGADNRAYIVRMVMKMNERDETIAEYEIRATMVRELVDLCITVGAKCKIDHAEKNKGTYLYSVAKGLRSRRRWIARNASKPVAGRYSKMTVSVNVNNGVIQKQMARS